MLFAIHEHELATGIHVPPHSVAPSHIPPHPILLCCPRAPASCIKHALALYFTYGNVHVSMLFSQIIPLRFCFL